MLTVERTDVTPTTPLLRVSELSKLLPTAQGLQDYIDTSLVRAARALPADAHISDVRQAASNTNDATQLGSAVHALIEKGITTDGLPKHLPLPANLAPLRHVAASWRTFYEIVGKHLDPIAYEERIYARVNGVVITGMPDLVAATPTGVGVFDWKVARALHLEQAVQVAIYALLLREVADVPVNEAYIVRLHKQAPAGVEIGAVDIDAALAYLPALIQIALFRGADLWLDKEEYIA